MVDTRPRKPGTTGETLSADFDGDGARLKQTENGVTTYYVRSTVFGGEVIDDLNAQGQKQTGYVYARGSLLAKQNTYLNVAIYQHVEPSQGAQWESYNLADGSVPWGETQLDPLGNDVGTEDPYLDSGGGGDGEFNKSYPLFGDASDLPFGCTVDGIPWPCTMAFKYAALNPKGVQVSISGRYLDTLGGFVGGGILRQVPGNASRLLGSSSSHNSETGEWTATVTVAPDESGDTFEWEATETELASLVQLLPQNSDSGQGAAVVRTVGLLLNDNCSNFIAQLISNRGRPAPWNRAKSLGARKA